MGDGLWSFPHSLSNLTCVRQSTSLRKCLNVLAEEHLVSQGAMAATISDKHVGLSWSQRETTVFVDVGHLIEGPRARRTLNIQNHGVLLLSIILVMCIYRYGMCIYIYIIKGSLVRTLP